MVPAPRAEPAFGMGLGQQAGSLRQPHGKPAARSNKAGLDHASRIRRHGRHKATTATGGSGPAEPSSRRR